MPVVIAGGKLVLAVLPSLAPRRAISACSTSAAPSHIRDQRSAYVRSSLCSCNSSDVNEAVNRKVKKMFKD